MFYCIGLVLKNGQPLYVGNVFKGLSFNSPIWHFCLYKYLDSARFYTEGDVREFYYPLVHNMLCRKDVKSIFIGQYWYDKNCHKVMLQRCMIDNRGDIVPFR